MHKTKSGKGGLFRKLISEDQVGFGLFTGSVIVLLNGKKDTNYSLAKMNAEKRISISSNIKNNFFLVKLKIFR